MLFDFRREPRRVTHDHAHRKLRREEFRHDLAPDSSRGIGD
jgi:hypothetical protein